MGPTSPGSSAAGPHSGNSGRRPPTGRRRSYALHGGWKPGRQKNSGAFSGNLVDSTAAMEQNFSVHIDMSRTGGRTGMGGWPGVWAGMSSMEISDISTNSRSKIRFTTFGRRVAAGWYVPGWERLGCPSPAAGGNVAGVADPGRGGLWMPLLRAAAGGVRPVCPGTVGVKVGNVGRGRPGVGPGRGNVQAQLGPALGNPLRGCDQEWEGCWPSLPTSGHARLQHPCCPPTRKKPTPN